MAFNLVQGACRIECVISLLLATQIGCSDMDRNEKVYHSRAELVQSYRNLAATLAKILADLEPTITPGLRTEQLDSMAQQLFVKYHVRSYFKGYNQYPAYISTSINDEVVNTIPSALALAEGDLLSIQVGITDGIGFSYQAWTYPVGKISPADRKLLDAGLLALRRAIPLCTMKHTPNEIGEAIQSTIAAAGFSVNQEFGGHGMGYKPHESPMLLDYRSTSKESLVKFLKGQILSVVVFAQAGYEETHIEKDGWNVRTDDGQKAVQFSQILIVGDTPNILTSER
jgi:methionyl aminopeptidase